MLGKWTEGSGWTDVLVNAGVATQGVADSFITASHLTRTRRVHQVTAASLFIMMGRAYNTHKVKAEEDGGSVMSYEDWKKAMAEKSTQFLYWSTVLSLELMCLHLVRSFRSQFYLVSSDLTRITSLDVCHGPH